MQIQDKLTGVLNKIKGVSWYIWAIIGLSTLCLVLFAVLVSPKKDSPSPTNTMDAFSDVMKTYIDTLEARAMRREYEIHREIKTLQSELKLALEKDKQQEKRLYKTIREIAKLKEQDAPIHYRDSTVDSIIDRLRSE